MTIEIIDDVKRDYLTQMVVSLEYEILKAVIHSQKDHESRRDGHDEAILKALTCKRDLERRDLPVNMRTELYRKAEEALAVVFRRRGGVTPQG